ncbi:MAG: hypothetical protein M1309_00055 [Actinobacteria bacterium]|nr:hypothetical protein [Actinomycetota bacterium]
MATIAFPALATGTYGYPLAETAQIAVAAVADYLRSETNISKVSLFLFSKALSRLLPGGLSKSKQKRPNLKPKSVDVVH